MKKLISVFLLLVLMGIYVPAVSATCVPCQNITITGLTCTSAGVVPMKVGFTGLLKGPVNTVTYNVIDPKTGAIVVSCRGFCAKCKAGTCSSSLTLTKVGTFDVQMIGYGYDGCCVSVMKKAAIVATAGKIAPPVTPVCTPNFTDKINKRVVTFNDTTAPKANSWSWNFGDGTKSTKQNPTHTYKKAGTYNVCLTACCPACSCCKTKCVKITIK